MNLVLFSGESDGYSGECRWISGEITVEFRVNYYFGDNYILYSLFSAENAVTWKNKPRKQHEK